MSLDTDFLSDLKAKQPSSLQTQRRAKNWRHLWLRSSLWLCLLLALIVRIWVVVRTQGFVEGDEVLTGIQAQQILYGHLPVYFYGQPYMGSLEAYLIAPIFAIFGSSTWTLRIEPILLSLILVWLTWRFAHVLADGARLSPAVRRFFATIAALVAALPPLYDVIAELHTWGGYIEIFVLTLLLLISALRLTQRWQAGAASKELAWRWAGIGFLVGLGFWIYPLIISAVVASALWILGYAVLAVCRHYRQHLFRRDALDRVRPREQALHGGRDQARPYEIPDLKKLLLALVAVPSALVGFAPALIWGAQNNWANIAYILNLGGGISQRMNSISRVAGVYLTCIGPHVVSGALPGEAHNLVQAHLPMLILGAGCIACSFVLLLASFCWRLPLLVQARNLAALPLLFGLWTALSFSTGKNSVFALISCDYDPVGRYATPLVLVLPFFYATVFTVLLQFLWAIVRDIGGEADRQRGRATVRRPDRRADESADDESGSKTANGRPYRDEGQGGIRHSGHEAEEAASDEQGSWIANGRTVRLHRGEGQRLFIPALLFAVLLSTLALQAFTYQRTNMVRAFESPYCHQAPVDDGAIVRYLEGQHVRYAWSTNWIAYRIVFETNSQIIVADAMPFIPPVVNLDRIPANAVAVRHADRPSLIVFVWKKDAHPPLLRALDKAGVTYKAARFPATSDTDILVVTPLNRTVSPFESKATASNFASCSY